MSTRFTRVAQANVDHYNEHPKRHTFMVVAYWYAAMAVLHALGRRWARKEYERRTNHFWN